MRRLLTISLVVLFTISHVWGQSGFDPAAYSNYLKANQDLTFSQLYSLYPTGTYYQDRLYPVEPYHYEYFDSIVEAFGITEDELALLAKNKFVVTERLSYRNMVEPLDEIFHKDLPVFITTDFILKTLHLSYDNILMDLEMQVLEPNLKEILSLMRGSYPDLASKYKDIEGLEAALEDVDIYITIALSLVDSIRYDPFLASENQIDTLLQAIYAEQVFDYPLFADRNRLLDFSQFRPRGHYTAPDLQFSEYSLTNYFRAMMWLGRMEFYLTPPPGYPGPPWTKEEIRRMHLAAFLLQELLETSGGIDILLENDRMIEFLVGESDNLTPWEYGRIIKDISGLNAADQLLSDEIYDPYYELVETSLEAEQKILSCILYADPFDPEPEELPVSYRLFGQRFIIDSYVFANVVFDRIIYQGAKVWRGLPDPLDAMFVLGNNNARELLQPELEAYHYASQLDALRYLVESYDEDFWNKSLYNTWLQAIRELNPAEESAGTPYFMKTVAWQHQKLNTQLASWAQLRHDNLLYAKQSYTWGIICSFPHSFVEPYPEFYRTIENFCDAAYTFFSSNGELGYSITAYFIKVRNIMQQLARIAEKELRMEPLNKDEINYLKGMMREPDMMCGAPPWAGWFLDLYYDIDKLTEEDDYVIADVHTQATDGGGNLIGKILHVGTGKVNLGIFLAGSPSDNYKPVAFIGPCMSYYEHTTLDWDRKTDEWWSALIQDGFPVRPEWTNVYLANNKGGENTGGLRLKGGVYNQQENTGIDEIRRGSLRIYPNPVSDQAVIHFNLKSNASVQVNTYDVMGRKIEEIYNEYVLAGEHWIEWPAGNLTSGMYYVVLNAGKSRNVLKIIRE
jgi:hypothetical protein